MSTSDPELGGFPETLVDEKEQQPPLAKLPVTRTLVDLALLATTALGFETIVRYIGPYERGFFCDDESIRLPYKRSTVSAIALFVYVLSVPALAILAVELYRLVRPVTCREHYSLYEWGREFLSSRLFIRFCLFYGYFLLALVSTHVFMGLAKFTVGRLRPHFLDVCQPSVNITDCGVGHAYITDFTCTSHKWSLVFDARLSFFSGHSALSMCAATFTTLYLQTRLEGLLESRVAVPLMQLAVMCSAMFIAYSRIFDHMHHWADVLIGMLLGIVVAAFVVVYLGEFEMTTAERKAVNKGDHRARRHHYKQQRHHSARGQRASYQSNGVTHRALNSNATASTDVSPPASGVASGVANAAC